ncbi:haloacid dehalogenase [Mycolicibacillus trivialis]|uniref:Haloacid dehalogenase n=1 Tax=Mycolicibacillus trivialis TaxID=1798 RepID=A0A1X2EMS9_9MYCO|nr:haloacid dehalogenase [Mycolicibacillus trivialis]
MGCLTVSRTPLLLRPLGWGIQTTVGAVEAAARTAANAVETVGEIAAASVHLAAVPVREGLNALAGEGAPWTRGCWRGDERAWIEVPGLAGPDGAMRAEQVQTALAGQPGVASVAVNRPLERVVIGFDPATPPNLRELARVIDDTEPAGAAPPTARTTLPGDGLVLVTRGAMVAINAAGFAIAVAGRMLRWPAAPLAVDAAATFANYQPWLRRRLHERIGAGPTDTVLSLLGTGARIATLSPANLAVDVAMQGLKAAESRAAADAWRQYEPTLARAAADGLVHRAQRPVPLPEGAAQRYYEKMAFAQVIGAGLVGVLTRNLTMTANAVVVTAPKAVRATTEAFAATLGRTLAERYGVLVLQAHGLRRLDRVDTVLIDPRVLCTDQLRVAEFRGGSSSRRADAWPAAQGMADREGIRPGWHAVPGYDGIEVLLSPTVHPLAVAVIAEARAAEVELVSLDLDLLGELRPGFDELAAVADGPDAALAEALTELQRSGRTVAVVSATAAEALCNADVGLGVVAADDDAASPPWQADLIVRDLTAVWQVLHALPAARAATDRGIAISTGATSLGALLMVPGVRGGRRLSPVTAGAAAGAVSGYVLARRATAVSAPRPAPAHEWHAMSVEQVRRLLPEPTAELEVPSTEPPNMFWQFLTAVRAELSDPLMPVLGLCSAATAMLGSPIDAMMVSTVLIGNCMLAAGQQLQAENRLNRLLAQQTPPARRVTADGYAEVPAEALAPGTLIEVRSNEVVPADARLVEAADLEVDESSLTGESLSVDKQTAATPGAELADRRCMLYAGSTVVAGTAVAIVTAVGAETQARRAAELAAGELPVVGLQHQLSVLMNRAFPASAAGGVMVGLLGLLRGGTLRIALGNAIAVAVAAVPEGMPLMATLAQHASGQRLSKVGALVRIPRTVEALGRVEVVCFDKTGTLSENRLRVTGVHPTAGHTDEEVLTLAAQAAPAPEGAAHAHATDQAVIEAAAALPPLEERWLTPDAHVPFRSGRAFSASVSGRDLVIKGAPEVVLAACDEAPGDAEERIAALASQGLRVIAVAGRTLAAAQDRSVGDDGDAVERLCESGLSLVGFLGIADTPREEAPQLLADLAARGVAIRLITGDHPVTATAIAAELGMPVTAEQVITGSQWNALSRKEQQQVVAERVIFARMSPENKVQVVQTLERSGRVTAMVGDGANDAAAIRAASVGLGVVARGSDSAHTTADIVLTDGRIGALADAIDEGRRLWRGVQLAVTGLLGGNIGEVIFGVIGTAITGTSPLNNRQLLLMNMLTDALPATSVAVSTPAGPADRVVGGIDERALVRAVAVRGVITGLAASAAWSMAALTGRPQRAATIALISLVTTELAQTLVDSHAPLVWLTATGSFAVFAAAISLPGVSQLLGCTPIGPLGWAQALASSGAAVGAIAVAPRLLPARWQAGATAGVVEEGPEPVGPTGPPEAATDGDGAILAITRPAGGRRLELVPTP